MGAQGLGNLIGILELTAPERLAKLRTVIPNAKIWLKNNSDLSHLFNKDDPEQASAILSLSEQALSEFEPLLQTGLRITRRKIKTAHLLSLVGKLISAAGTTGTIALILTATNNQLDKALTTSIIALAGTLVSIVVQFLNEDITGAEKGTFQQFTTLKDYNWRVRVMLTKIRAMTKYPNSSFSEADIAIIQEANSPAGEVYAAVENLGVPVNSASNNNKKP